MWQKGVGLILLNWKKMNEVGIVNRLLAKVISEQGHQDLLMVVDAGFGIPKNREVVDLSLGENKPMVLEVPFEEGIKSCFG